MAIAIAGGGCGKGGAKTEATGTTPRVPTATETPRPAPRPARRGARLVRIGRFNAPVYVASPPGDSSRVFVVEQAGRIRVVRRGRTLRRPFLDIRGSVLSGGERGLLSMAFAPNYRRSKLFYVYFTDRGGDIRVQQLRAASPDRAAVRSRRDVISQDHSQFPNHNGGQLQFGPGGHLYIGLGDGGSEGDPSNHAQSLGTLLGKILRIDPRPGGGYSVPGGNPFTGRAGARREVYAYGLRNPWRFSFDRRTGDLAIGDVGEDAEEEVDFAREGRAKGKNYGWRRWEGRRRFSSTPAPGAVFPVIQRSHAAGWCSLIGGYVVRDRSLRSLYGRYLYGDNCKRGIRSARLSSGRARGDRRTALGVPALSSFGEDSRGRVYVTSLAGGVYRIAPR